VKRSSFVLATLLWASTAHAQKVDPMEGVAPEPQGPTVVVQPPPEAAKPPPEAAKPAPPPEKKDEKKEEAKGGRTAIGIGPAAFVTTGTGSFARPGVALQLASHVPIQENMGIGIRFSWMLTEFRRTEDMTRTAYRIGRWTTNAYGDVYDWAAQKDDARLFRWMGAFFAFFGLLFPYIVSGLFYVASPFAATTALELGLTFDYSFGTDRLRSGPYLKAGLGLVGYVHPRQDKLLGGIGPTFGAGVRFGDHYDLGLNATFIPSVLHGQTDRENGDVVLTSLTLGFY
jgi:hypothetical protein